VSAEETGGARAAAWLRRPPAPVALAVAGAGLWLLAAQRLWRTTVPPGLRLSGRDPHADFGAAFLARSASYERFLAIDALLAAVVLLVVLALYARRGARLMRESAAGPIGTGMMLGMLGLGIAWIAQVPFGLAAVWWERRHGVSHQGYAAAVVQSFLQLGGTFLAISFALLVTMFLARLLRGWWWLAAAPFFVGLALLTAYLSPYLVPDAHPLRQPAALADARALGRIEGVPGTRVEVQRVARSTTAPNAEAVGFGATRRVILWDTLLDGRFDRREVRTVLAHELAHLARRHTLEGVGWLALFLAPVTGLIVLVTRRRGGLARLEAEADWSALQATRDPAAARSLFRALARTSLADPDPPAWIYLLDEDHPTIVQRIAMTEEWRARR
jgi:Zn-dependent protease with chaperone function